MPTQLQQYEDPEDIDIVVTPDSGQGDPALKQYLIEEFVEDYSHGLLSRRDALKRLAGITGSVLVASNLLSCAPQPTAVPPPAAASPTTAATSSSAGPSAVPTKGAASSATSPSSSAASTGPTPNPVTVKPDDPDIVASPVQFPGEGATIQGYLARPKGDGPFPAVLICHENRGLVEHTRDIARRFAKAGYVGHAIDLLSRNAGTQDPAQVPGILSNQPVEQQVGDFRSGLVYLQGQPFVRKDRVGMTGFCFGGGIAWRAATKIPELRAVVPFYGPNPPLEDVKNVQAACLGIYGANDTRITSGADALEAAMKQNGKTYEKIIYPNAAHAFFNDTGPSYNAEAAKDAWSKMLDWFAKYLKS